MTRQNVEMIPMTLVKFDHQVPKSHDGAIISLGGGGCPLTDMNS